MNKPIGQQSLEFDNFLDGVSFRISNRDLTPEKRKERRLNADISRRHFCQTYFPQIFSIADSALHSHIDNLETGMHNISAFRKAGKTARVVIGHVVKDLVDGVGGVVNVNARTIDLAKKRCAAITRIIKRNKLLLYDYDVRFTKESEEWTIVNDTHLVAGSVQTGLRNILDDDFKRIKKAVNDDLTDKQSGKRDKEKAMDFLEYEVAGQLEENGLAINLFNDTEPDSPGVLMREKYPDSSFVFPALANAAGEPDMAGESTWPEYRTTAEWSEFFADKPYIVIMGDYQCMPLKDGKNFNLDWIKFINISHLQIIASISACDPAFGQSPLSCYKALVTLGAVSNNEMTVLDIYLRREKYEQMFDYLDAARSRFPNWKVLFFEDDFKQWALAEPYYQKWCEKRKKTLPIIRHNTKELKTANFGSDKDSRILNLVLPHQLGTISYNSQIERSRDFELYKAQYVGFGADKEKKDGLDALATAYIMLPRWIEKGCFKPLAVRETAERTSFWGRWLRK